MVSILGNRSLTDEVMTTTMCLGEQTLNVRPVTPTSDDHEDLEELTPKYFIMGRANVCILFTPNAEVYSNHRKMFRYCQAYSDMFWQRWVRTNFLQNTVRSQWNNSQTNIEIGDLVWFIEDNVKWSQYRMARIVEIYSGKDGVARSALIRTPDGTLERPVVKLAPLFIQRFPYENGASIDGAPNIFRV